MLFVGALLRTFRSSLDHLFVAAHVGDRRQSQLHALMSLLDNLFVAAHVGHRRQSQLNALMSLVDLVPNLICICAQLRAARS